MSKSNKRKLYRSNNDKVLAGIFGGLGEYFDIDSNLLRLIGLVILFFTAFVPFLIIYFVAMFIIPSDRERSKEEKSKNKNENEDENKNYSRSPVYKKWWFWLIIVIIFLPAIFMILGFVLFTERGGFVTEEIEFRQERIIEQLEDGTDYIERYQVD